MSVRTVMIIGRKEIRDALRNRWFQCYAAAFTVLALAMAQLSLAGTTLQGLAGFGRTTAALVNLVLLFVPLMALSIAAPSLAGERERGTLAYLLAQPVNRLEVLFGKFVGLGVSLVAALGLGFGVAGLSIAAKGHAQGLAGFLVLTAMTMTLALAMLSVGLLVSALVRKASVAVGMVIVLWLALTLFSDLGLMGGSLMFRLRMDELFHLALLNPLEVFKMSVLRSMHASLDVLGPAATYAVQEYGRWLGLIFAAALTAWIVAPMALAALLFARRPLS
ncbi:MAG: ABC transporter permease [Phycisphaeraceae bacterium]|nr:ABC transporter permease [Phycisphaeraceae bacterium]